MNLRPFKLYRVYLKPLNSSSLGDFSWRWILKSFIYVQIENGKIVAVCPRPPWNVALGGFTSWSYSGRQRNVLKSVQSSCFAHKTNCFLTLLSSSSSLLKVPIVCTTLTLKFPFLLLIHWFSLICSLSGKAHWVWSYKSIWCNSPRWNSVCDCQ